MPARVVRIKRTDVANKRSLRVSRDIKAKGYAESIQEYAVGIQKDTKWYINKNKGVAL